MFGYGLGNSPSLINAAIMLAESGYGVDFFTCGTYLGKVTFQSPFIQVHTFSRQGECEGQGLLPRLVRYLSRKVDLLVSQLPVSWQISLFRARVRQEICAFADDVSSFLADNKYRCFIGVEPFGMMTAKRLSMSHGSPYVYYNLELHYAPDIVSPNEFVMKEMELEVNRGAAFTITLDEERARLIALENRVDEGTFVTVPVCADGEPFRLRTELLRERLGIPQGKKIILYAGFLADWAMCAEISMAARSWPDDWVLVFHSHGYDNDAYIDKLMEISGDNVYFSLEPVAYETLPLLLSSADIGLALYRDLGTNFTHIASASGKLAHYLKSGLPVVVNDYPSVSRIVSDYSCGKGVHSTAEIRRAIEEILQNYSVMREGAFLCYQENYRFSKHFQKVVDRIGLLL